MTWFARPIALTVVGVLVIGCGSASGSPMPAGTSSAPVALSPSLAATTVPSPTVTESPFERVDPTALRWRSLDEATAPDLDVLGLIGFRGGYVAFGGPANPFQEPLASYSADGRAWVTVSLAEWIPNCPDWGPEGDEEVPDAEVWAGTSDGDQIVLTGALKDLTPSTCSGSSVVRPQTWISDDGRSWRRSERIDAGGGNVRMLAAWPTPAGWQGVDEAMHDWESTDGIRWSKPTTVEPRVTGTVPAECASGVLKVLAPTTTAGLWLVPSGETMCTSSDLRSWRSVKLPLPDLGSVHSVVRTRYGFLALGSISCIGIDCPPDERLGLYYLSGDGLEWTRLDLGERVDSVAHGPSGTLGLGGGVVWELAN